MKITEKDIQNASYDFTESEGFRHGARWALDQVSADSDINAELLAALEDARNVLALAITKFGDESTDNEDSQDDVNGLLTRIDEAIEKARGE